MALVIVAVTRAVFAAETFSATSVCALFVPVSASTLNMIAEGAASSSVTVTVTSLSVSAEYFESVVVDTA